MATWIDWTAFALVIVVSMTAGMGVVRLASPQRPQAALPATATPLERTYA
jgi:hypothetical protein